MSVLNDPFKGRSVPATIIQYAVPTILSQLVTLIYNLADTFFVGHTNDPYQIAALTLSFPLFMTITMIGNLFGIGANSLISRSLGAKHPETARKASVFAFYGGLITMLIWIIFLNLLMKPILTTLGAITAETYEATKSYLTWTVIIGGLPTVAALLAAHCIRGEGNTKQAGIGVAIGGILNIILDPVFVNGMSMGVAGAGIATCISNCVSLLYFVVLIYRSKNTVVILNPLKLTFDSSISKSVVLVGLPAAAVVLFGSSANIVLTHLLSGYGDVAVAGYGVVQKLATITIQTTVGLTQGVMPLLGYSYGANDNKRVKEINRWSFLILAVFAAVCFVIFELLPSQLISLLTNETSTIETGSGYMRIYMWCVFGMCFVFMFNCIFQAMGKWLQSLLLSVIRQCLLLIPLLIIFENLWGASGIVTAQPIADTISFFVGLLMYRLVLPKRAKNPV